MMIDDISKISHEKMAKSLVRFAAVTKESMHFVTGKTILQIIDQIQLS